MQHLLQGVVDLGAPAQGLGKGGSAHGHDHELLEVHVVVGMHTAVQDVHHGRRQKMRVRTAHVLVQRQLGSLRGGLGHGQRRAQDGVGAEGPLVLRAVGLDHGGIHHALILGLKADEHVGDLVVHMGHGIQRALAQITALVAVAQLHGLESARGSARGNRRAAEGAVFQHNFHFDGGVAARVENLAPVHIDDDAHVVPP